VVYSTIDSSEVAQYLVSPSTAGISHSCRVFSMDWALKELGSNEKWLRIAGSLAEEKGIELAACRERKVAPNPAVVLMKCMVTFVPGSMSFSKTALYALVASYPLMSTAGSSK